MTIRQLLTHESGLPDIMPNTGAMPGDSETAAWTAVLQMPLQSAPGVRFSYNQTNYLLLGKIIQSLSAKSFPDFIAERQFRVVGMPRTAAAGFGDSHGVIAHGARGDTFFRIEGQCLRTTDTLGNVFDQFPPSLCTAPSRRSAVRVRRSSSISTTTSPSSCSRTSRARSRAHARPDRELLRS